MLMELIVQLGMAGTATALGLLFLRQLPTVTALRWWFYAYSIGLAALLLELLAAGRPTTRFATFLLIGALVCGCAQVYWVARGLLSLQGNRRIWTYASLVFGFSVLLGFTLLAVLAGSAEQRMHSMVESRHLILPTICGILGFHLWTKSAGSRRETWVLSAVPLLGFAGGLLDRAVSLHVLPQVLRHVVPLGSAVWAGIGQCGVALAMAYLVHNEARAGEAELRTSSERLRQLVDSADYGICEVDTRGCLTFVNRTAAAMLATGQPRLTGVPMDEILDAADDEASAQALREFILRPNVPVRQVKARIRRADGTAISTKWSSFPIVREGNPAGAVVTLRDITQEETTDRFINLRSALLEMITRNKSVEEVSSLLATAVEERLPGLCCSVLVCEGDCFRVAAAPTLPSEFREAIDGLPCDRLIPPNHPKRKRTLHDWESALRTIAANHGFGGTWTELLVSTANELLGTIVLNGPDVGSPSLEQGDTLKEAARLAALAVENHRSLQRLLHQGHHDSLTGLPNRLLFADRLKHALARAQRAGTQIALMCIDLDRFKHVNDTLGHDLGDLFLQQVSVRLAARIRASDTLARTGGDEFTAVIADIRDRHDAERLAEALLASLRDPFEVEGHTLYGAASIGIALYPQDGSEADALHRNADRAMYRAKAHGRNAVRSYSSDDARDAGDSMDIELHLHRAIEQGNFAVHFQPQFTCDRRLLGFEALLRFRHPRLGLVPPSRFIPIAEESGLILPIGQWVLDEVCRQIAEWQSKGMRVVRVAVNVSPLQFSQAHFSETVARALRASNVQPDLLELELTEGVLMNTGHDSARQIDLIAEMGVRLAVDDFGTGYSSLNYLHQLPIHVLKIDRSFVNKMLEPAGTRSIVEAIISLAHGLRLQTVAEGVENEDQLAILQAAGCDLIQGYIFSQPLPAHEASRLLRQDAVAEYGGAVISREPSPANGRYAISAPSTQRSRRGRS